MDVAGISSGMCFRIEYQLEGERVIRALQDANELPIITDDVHDAQQKVKIGLTT